MQKLIVLPQKIKMRNNAFYAAAQWIFLSLKDPPLTATCDPRKSGIKGKRSQTCETKYVRFSSYL